MLNCTELSAITHSESNLPVAPSHIGDRHKSKLLQRLEGWIISFSTLLTNPLLSVILQPIQEIKASLVSQEVNWELDLNHTQAEVTK